MAHLFPGADLFKELSEIYNLRSNAAHGNRSSNNEFQASAPRARELLAYAIYGVLDLASKGELGLDAAEGNLGHSVKTLVLARSLRPVVPTPPA